MPALGLEAFDSTYQKTNIWLNEIMDGMAWENRHRAYLALRAVLHNLRDRLPMGEAVHLGDQLPMLIRGIYYEGWKPAGKPERIKRKEEFLDKVSQAFSEQPELDLEQVCRVVFQVLERNISSGEIQHVKGSLPKELLEIWPVSGSA
jgi:uncharacterized protein (DUF2267 family)